MGKKLGILDFGFAILGVGLKLEILDLRFWVLSVGKEMKKSYFPSSYSLLPTPLTPDS